MLPWVIWSQMIGNGICKFIAFVLEKNVCIAVIQSIYSAKV